MTTNYPDDSYSLHTDFYQINMMKVYWDDGIAEKKAVFEAYFRSMPFNAGFAVFAGLERVITYIQNLKFTESDIAYLRETTDYPEDFLTYLSEFKFKGKIRSMREGEIVFNNEPLFQVEAGLAECQLIETAVLNALNYQTLIATKASRIRYVAGPNASVMEFGTRRAQEFDAALWGTRSAYIGGFDSTSNVRAGKLFDIPVSGTHAHAMIQAYKDEYVAFTKYATSHKDCVFLVDTYDTLHSGIPNAIKVANEFGDKINFVGIRIDSGDLSFLSKKAREMLDDAGYPNAKIVASNDLDENMIMHLMAQNACIDVWGVGTKLITAYDQPSLGGVYKMVAIEDENGQYMDTIKLSSNSSKVTTPGRKNIFRIIDNQSKRSEGDYITLADESMEGIETLTMFHPVHSYIQKDVSNFTAQELLQDIFIDGELVYQLPTVHEIKEFAKENKKVLWDEYRRISNPEEYPVDLSDKCWENRNENIKSVRDHVKETTSVHFDRPSL